MRRSIFLVALVLAALVAAGTAQAKDKAPPYPDGATIASPSLPGAVVSITAVALTPEPGIIGTSKTEAPSPDYLPGDGSGQVGPLCAVAGVRSGYDGVSYDDTVTAMYHWCMHNGNVWDAYGWTDQSACQLVCERAGTSEYNFSYGHWVRAYWTVFSISKYVGVSWHTSATACIAVDGWFNVWGC